MANAATSSKSDWINLAEAAALLGIDRRRVVVMREVGAIRYRQFPGSRPEYSRADLLRIARECVSPQPVPAMAM